MINLTYDNKFRHFFKNQVFGSKKMNHIIQIAQFQCKNIKGFDHSHLNYLIFQFEKVEKELSELNELKKITEQEKQKSKENLDKYKHSQRVIRIFEMLNHWENFLAGIKQSLDFITSVFDDFFTISTKKNKCTSYGFIDSEYSKILELPKIFSRSRKQYQNIITTRNAFTHNYFMKSEGEFIINYLNMIKFGEFKINYSKKYHIVNEANLIFQKYIQLVGNYVLIMFKRQEFYNKLASDLSLKKAHLKLLNKYVNSKNDFFFKTCFLDNSNRFKLTN